MSATLFIAILLGILVLYSGSVQAQKQNNCTSIDLPAGATAVDCPSYCVYEKPSAAEPYCREKHVCDVPLNYSLPSPYGCPAGECEVKSRVEDIDGDGDTEYCGIRTFESLFEMLYWGKNGYFPFGYLFWNILVALCVVLYLQFSPRFIASIVSRLVNGLVLDPSRECFYLRGLSVMIIGGRAVFSGLEYLSPNVHIKCVDISLNIKWWRGSSDIRQAPSAVNANTKFIKLPFRMSVYFTGLEISLFNNTEKYNYVERFVVRAIYRDVFKTDPPESAKAEYSPSRSTLSSWFCFRILRSWIQRFFRSGEESPAVGSKSDTESEANQASANGPSEQPFIDPIPGIYNLFPITRIQCRNLVIYVGAPTLPTTLVMHIRNALCLHYTEPIGDAPNKGLDSFRYVNKADFRGVVISMLANSGYIASEEMSLMRGRLEKKSVDAREVFSEILRNVKTSFNEVKIGMKDVRTDLGHTLGVQQQSVSATDKSRGMPEGDGESSLIAEEEEAGRVDSIFQSVRRNLASRQSKRMAVDEEVSDEENDDRLEPAASYVSFVDERMQVVEEGSIAADQPTSESAKPQKRSFWDRLFRRSRDQRVDEHGTLLQVQLNRERQGRYTVMGFNRSKKKGPRPVPEPDILRTGKVEVIIHIDAPGRVGFKQKPEEYGSSAPRQNVVINIGGGDDADETQIVLGPWVDKQRALFQEHFFPYVYEDLQLYQPEIGKAREPIFVNFKINFSRHTEVRLPFREQDLGLLASGRRKNFSGGGDSGQNEDSEFWLELYKQLKELNEKQIKADETEAVRMRSVKSRRVAKEAMNRRRSELEPVEIRALRESSRDGWILVPDFSMDSFLDICIVDANDEQDLARLVDTFNAVSSYQTALVELVRTVDPSIMVSIPDFATWSFEERARWIWGEFAGREREFVSVIRQKGSDSAHTKDGFHAALRNLDVACRNLPVPPEFSHLLRNTDAENSPSLLQLATRAQDEDERAALEETASDPRHWFGKWFRPEGLDNLSRDEHAHSISLEPVSGGSTHFQGVGATHGPNQPVGDSQSDPSALRVRGPISYAAACNTSCGWIDVGVQPGSFISITYPWYPLNNDGIALDVEVELKKPKLYASATRSTIAEATLMKTTIHIHYPVAWNGEQTWKIENTLHSPRIRMLKTDIQALADLGKDWSSNSIEPPSVGFFVPAVYDMCFELHNADILFNVNESNVVDLPEDTVDHNTYICFSVPFTKILVASKARELQPRKAAFDIKVEFLSGGMLSLPVRASLVLPVSHPRNAVPMPVGGQFGRGQGGVSRLADPVFMEMQSLILKVSYMYHYQIQVGSLDVMNVNVEFENARCTVYADALVAIKRWQENYLGMQVCHVSQEGFRAMQGENVKTLLAYRNWYETADGSLHRIRANDYETNVHLLFTNAIVLLPTVLYPHVSTDGVLSAPDEEAITLFSRQAAIEIRLRDEHFAEYSCEIAPLRLQVPGFKTRVNDGFNFHESLMSRIGTAQSANISDSKNESFSRVWLRGQIAGSEVGQFVINGIRIDCQTLYGRPVRENLSPLVGYRTCGKVSVGASWGDLEIPQLSQIRDAVGNFDLMLSRLASFDRLNGGTRDPALCCELPLGQQKHPESFSRVRAFASENLNPPDEVVVSPDYRKRRSSLSLFGDNFDGILSGEGSILGKESERASDEENLSGETEGTSTSEIPSMVPELSTTESRTVFFTVVISKGSNLPGLQTLNGKGVGTNANSFVQVVYGGQGFRSGIVADSSNPAWGASYTFLCGCAANYADIQDLRVGIFDGSYGWKRKIGDVVFPANAIGRAIDSAVNTAPIQGTLILDGYTSHQVFQQRCRPQPSKSNLNSAFSSHLVPQQPRSVVLGDSSHKFTSIEFSINFFSMPGTVSQLANALEKRDGRRIEQVFDFASAVWQRELVRRNSYFGTGASLVGNILGGDNPAQGNLVLDPRILAARRLQNRFVSNAAQHILQTQAMIHIVAAYAHNTLTVSTGPVNLMIWSPAVQSVLDCSISQCKIRADSLHNPKFAWKISTDGREDVSIEVRHLKRSSTGQKTKDKVPLWSLVGHFGGSFDARAFKIRSNMPGEVAKQNLFLETHEFSNRTRRALDALAGLHSRGSVLSMEQPSNQCLNDILSLMPRVPRTPVLRVTQPPPPPPDEPPRRPSSMSTDADEFASAMDPDEHIEDDVLSFASASEWSLDAEKTGKAADRESIGGETSSSDIDSEDRNNTEACYPHVYVSTRFGSLPMEGPVSSYETSNLEPFLPAFTIEQFVETNDYWYGSALGYASSALLGTSSGSHQTREMGIAPSSHTRVSCYRAPLLPVSFESQGQSSYQMESSRKSFGSGSPHRQFVPVAPSKAKTNESQCSMVDDSLETVSVRIHIGKEIQAMFTPTTVTLAEDMLQKWFPMQPTVSVMSDYFEKNYLVLSAPPVPYNRIIPSSQQTKLLLTCEEGISVTLVHGSKWTPQTSGGSESSPGKHSVDFAPNGGVQAPEMVYASRVCTGPLALAKRTTRARGIGFEDMITLDASSSSLITQVASGYSARSEQGTQAYPVLVLSLRESIFIRRMEEIESEKRQSSLTSASFHGLDLMAGVDSVYVSYSTALTWGDLLNNYLKQSAAIWNQQRRQWAVLAGQVFSLSTMIDKTDVTGADKEPRSSIALLTWCRSESPVVSRVLRSRATFASAAPATNPSHANYPQQPYPSVDTMQDQYGNGHARAVEDEPLEIPVPGWSTLVRVRRIICFLPENYGVEDKMQKVEMDLYYDIAPVLSLDIVSGARWTFPDVFQKSENRGGAQTETVPNQHRFSSKGLAMTRVFLTELLMGLGNKVVERRKALGSSTLSYNFNIDGFVLRVLDSAVKDSRPPRKNPLSVPALAMKPATVLCMLIKVHPSYINITRHKKRGSNGKTDVRDRRASDMQLRKRLVPTSIFQTVRGISQGFQCTTSPELVLASRAGATVAAHYKAYLEYKKEERTNAQDTHNQIIHHKKLEALKMAANRKMDQTMPQPPPTSVQDGPTGAFSTNPTPVHRNTDEPMGRRTTLDSSSSGPQSTTNAATVAVKKEFNFNKSTISERIPDSSPTPSESMQRGGSGTLARTRSFASSPFTAWDDSELSKSVRDLNLSPGSAISERLMIFSSMDSHTDERKAVASAATNKKRSTRSSLVIMTGLSRPPMIVTDTQLLNRGGSLTSDGPPTSSDLAPSSTASFTAENFATPFSKDLPVPPKLPDVQRGISFDQSLDFNGGATNNGDEQSTPSLASPSNVIQSHKSSSTGGTGRVLQQTIVISFDLHSAVFTFSAEKSCISESHMQTAAANNTALVSWALTNGRLYYNSNSPSNDEGAASSYREFGVLNLDRFAVKVEGSGKISRNGVPWSVLGETENVIVNVVTGVGLEDLPSKAQSIRVMSDGKRSHIQVPLHAIDNKELEMYFENWANAFKVASEHADVIRLANLEKTKASQTEQQHPVDASDDGFLSPFARHLASMDTMPFSSEPVMAKDGIWPDPFGEVRLAPEDDSQNSSSSREGSGAMPPSSSVQPSPATPEKPGGEAAKRGQSATSRISAQYQAMMGKSGTNRHIGVIVRMHSVDVNISPVESVKFTSAFEHLTFAIDRKLDDARKGLVYLGPSSLRLSKVSKDARPRAPTREKPLEFSQALPSAWIVANLSSSLARRGTSRKEQASRKVPGGDNKGASSDVPSKRKIHPLSSTFAREDDVPSGPMPPTPKGQQQAPPKKLRVIVMIEAVRHSFTPSVVQQFIALQSGLKTEIALLLESAAKFSEQKRNAKSKLQSGSLIEGEYLLYLQGVSLCAKSSSQTVTPTRIWTEFGTGGIQLRVTSTPGSKGRLRCTASLNELSLKLLSGTLPGHGQKHEEPIHHAKLVTNVKINNEPMRDADGTRAHHSLNMTVSQTAMTLRPRYLSIFDRWRERYVRALEIYRANREGLEDVDEIAKKVWENVTEISNEVEGRRLTWQPENFVSCIVRVIITDTSLVMPYIGDCNDLSACVMTLKSIDFLGRSETLFEKAKSGDHDSSGGENTQPKADTVVSRFAQKASKEVRRRNSFATVTSSSPTISMGESRPAFVKPVLTEKRRHVARLEASELVASFVGAGTERVLNLRWISSAIHKGAKSSVTLPLSTASFIAEESKDPSSRGQMEASLQCSVDGPVVKCDRFVAPSFVGLWQTFTSPRKDYERMLRSTTDKSDWWPMYEDRLGPRQYSSGSLDEFDDDHVHVQLIHQESALFGADLLETPRNADQANPFDMEKDESGKLNREAAYLLVNVSVIVAPGKCDFWGDELIKQPSSGAQSHDGRRPHPKAKGPRHAMVAAQRAINELEPMVAEAERFPRTSHTSGLHGSRLGRQSVLGSGFSRSGDGGTVSQQLFVIHLPEFRFGLVGVGHDKTVETVDSHLLVETAPLHLSPTVVAFFEECLLDVHAALSEYDAAGSLDTKKSFSTPSGSHARFSANPSEDEPDAQPKLFVPGLKTAVFTLKVSQFELNLKSSQEQPMSSLKLRLDTGLNFVWSYGIGYWDAEQKQRLEATLLSIPVVSLIVHEVNPVIEVDVRGIRVAFNRLLGVFRDEALYTCINNVDSVKMSFNFWRIEAFFSLMHDWQSAWDQLLEERKVRKEFMEQKKLTRQKSQGIEVQPPPTKKMSNILRDPVHQRNVAAFDRFLQSRSSGHSAGVKAGSGSSDATRPFMGDTWSPAICLFLVTKVNNIHFQTKLGVLASDFECHIAEVVSRLALPGQVRDYERNLDPDTFYITASSVRAKVSGLYEGTLMLEPGCTWYVKREKAYGDPNAKSGDRGNDNDESNQSLTQESEGGKPRPMLMTPPKQAWQPWYADRTTFNRSFLHCADLHSTLARVITGEKAKTRTHLFMLSASRILLQIKDELDKDDSVLLLNSTIECNTFIFHLSVDAPPILNEAVEQLSEQIAIARRSMEAKYSQVESLRTNSAQACERSSSTSNRQARLSMLIADSDPSTLRAFRSVGTIRVKFNAFDVCVVHDPSSTAWETNVRTLGARFICRKSSDRAVLRDLTVTGSAEIFRYNGQHWKNHLVAHAQMASGIPHVSTAAQASSGESPESEEEPQPREGQAQKAGATSASAQQPLSMEDGAKRSQMKRQQVQAKRGRKNIISFPRSHLVMVTTQLLSTRELDPMTSGSKNIVTSFHLQPTIIYKFTSTFRDAISVSTDGREYAKLREVISQLRPPPRVHRRMDETLDDGSGTPDIRQFQQSDDPQSFVFEPQLNIMGEATTAVLDWFFDENIQLKKNELPKQIHISVTDTLEQILAGVQVSSTKVNNALSYISERKFMNVPESR